MQSNLLCGVGSETFDLVVSNPPYIASEDIETLQPEVRNYEPRLALDGGRDGLEFYRLLVPQARDALKLGGGLILEIGQGQAEAVRQILAAVGFTAIHTKCDLAELSAW